LAQREQATRFDVAVIGAGIVGTMIARELSRYRVEAVVLERGMDVAPACTKASNSVVHADSGLPGTDMRRFTAESHRLYDRLCEELAVAFNRCGELFVALEPEELPMLEERVEAAREKGVEMTRLSPSQVAELEPNLTGEVLGGALAPDGAVLYAFELAIALFENARANGVDFRFEAEVRRARMLEGGDIELETTRGPVRARYVVNAAGAWAGRVAALFGDHSVWVEYVMGQRTIMDRRLDGTVRHIVDRVKGSGVVIPTGHGNLFLGRADGELVDDPEVAPALASGIETILDEARALIPALKRSDMIRTFAGVWAEREDCLVEKSPACPRLVNVCLPPPGLTACPAAARHAMALLGELGLELKEDPSFDPVREPIPDFSELPPSERARLIERDPAFGRVVCRCETVTEGEIVEAIRRGARTVDGVKYRVRAGMGRCQGGFCGPRVMAILARELGLGLEEVTKKSGASWLVRPRGFEGANRMAVGDRGERSQ